MPNPATTPLEPGRLTVGFRALSYSIASIERMTSRVWTS